MCVKQDSNPKVCMEWQGLIGGLVKLCAYIHKCLILLSGGQPTIHCNDRFGWCV